MSLEAAIVNAARKRAAILSRRYPANIVSYFLLLGLGAFAGHVVFLGYASLNGAQMSLLDEWPFLVIGAFIGSAGTWMVQPIQAARLKALIDRGQMDATFFTRAATALREFPEHISVQDAQARFGKDEINLLLWSGFIADTPGMSTRRFGPRTYGLKRIISIEELSEGSTQE